MNMDVATATFGGNRNNSIMAGTISEPPPIPKSPPKKPTTKAMAIPTDA